MMSYPILSTTNQKFSISKKVYLKNNALKLLLLIAFLVSSDKQVFGQIPWTKDVNNPVMSGGTSGTWNRHVLWPTLLYNADSTRYEMWFCGSAFQNSFRPLRIGFATSPDGINWSKHPTPVLDLGDAGEWDESTVEEPIVLRENGHYKMWYISWTPPNGSAMIGYATSPDGIIWTKDTLNNPVMIPNSDP